MAKNRRTRSASWMVDSVPEELINSEVFQFKITLANGNQFDVDLVPDADIDYERLEEQLAECPQQYILWNSLYSELKAAVGLVERRIKIRRGVVTELAIELGREDKAVKLNNDQIKLVVEKDKELIMLERQLVLVQKHAGKMYGMCTALQMKSEHLRSLAGFKRGEMQIQRGT